MGHYLVSIIKRYCAEIVYTFYHNQDFHDLIMINQIKNYNPESMLTNPIGF